MESDEMFWERLAEMPLTEAEQELVLRREGNVLAIAMLGQEKGDAKNKREEKQLSIEAVKVAAQNSLINERIKYIRKLQDKIKWKDAVRALYGAEGVEACIVWIAQSEGRPLYQKASK